MSKTGVDQYTLKAFSILSLPRHTAQIFHYCILLTNSLGQGPLSSPQKSVVLKQLINYCFFIKRIRAEHIDRELHRVSIKLECFEVRKLGF